MAVKKPGWLAMGNVAPAGTKPSYIYFDGHRRYREENELIQNKVWFVTSA